MCLFACKEDNCLQSGKNSQINENSTDYEGKINCGISDPANPAFINPEPASMTTGWLEKASTSVGRDILLQIL